MPDGHPNHVNQVQTTLTDNLKPILQLAQVANPSIAIAYFGIDVLFRFIHMGVKIKRTVEAAQQALDSTVRAEGIFRSPIRVDLEDALVTNFFYDGECWLNYRKAYKDLEEVRLAAQNGPSEERKEAFDTLKVAYHILPDFYEDFKFDAHPLLDDLFGKWIDPADFNYYDLVMDVKPFLMKQETSIPEMKELLPEYSRMKLRSLGVNLKKVTLSQLNQLNDKIGNIVWDAVFGDQNIIHKTVKEIKHIRLEIIEEELEKLQEQLDDLDNLSPDDHQPGHHKKADRLDKRIKELEKMKERIDAVEIS